MKELNNNKTIVIAGFGSMGAFLYFLLRFYEPLIYTRRQNLGPYDVSFLYRGKKLLSNRVDKVKIIDSGIKKIDYLFLCSKSYDVKSYLESILSTYQVDNLVLTQNGVFVEDEVTLVFNGNLYYLTFTTAMDFKDNELLIYNPYKSQAVLTVVGSSGIENKLMNFNLRWNNEYCFFSYSYSHLDVRFSKLILNLVLNVVPAYFGGLPWEIFTSNYEAIELERKLIVEIMDFMNKENIRFYNFRSYNLNYISIFYKYSPFWLFKKIYSNPKILRWLRDNREPSFYRDLVLNKTKTEVDYYLGWFKKFSGYHLPTVRKIYEEIKKISKG
ncbi:MAG: 2-dehydropantoate 2-reductase N-terminal domain-containing protein [Candidatus Calescibacterium sp.]|nr:hypothetical protein [Candidatus Calescibacterium sp.]MDW8132058.1 2-dehydropantoate 2-reductase N-terminal domain-containing protein [Candidatus Calescibacterium sp.]